MPVTRRRLETKSFPTARWACRRACPCPARGGVRPRSPTWPGPPPPPPRCEEMAESLRRARESGRMVLQLPLDQVEAGYLVRDRLATDPEEMAALTESLRAHGQRTPDRGDADRPGRYGLISGWRRLRRWPACRPRPARPRFGHGAGAAAPARAGRGCLCRDGRGKRDPRGPVVYERARIAAQAVEAGVFSADDRAALRALFATASRGASGQRSARS